MTDTMHNRSRPLMKFQRRIALMFLYCGWEYAGLVEQPNLANTIEFEIKKALVNTRLINDWETCEWNRCGRTDKGVSGFRQVASLIVRSTDPCGEFVFCIDDTDCMIQDSSKQFAELKYVKILNGVLPKTIQMLAWSPVARNFSSRYCCNQRSYKYYFPTSNLDIKSMQKACEYLVGEHDFRNFCIINSDNLNGGFVRKILCADIKARFQAVDENVAVDSNSWPMSELILTASGFLWHQIRLIMSLLYEIGKGREQPELILELLDTEKIPSRPTYNMATGIPLCFYDCEYNSTSFEWKWDYEALNKVKRNLLYSWTDLQTKCSVIRGMVDGINSMVPGLPSDSNFIADYIRPVGTSDLASKKRYIPIKERSRCDSVQVKRKKLLMKKGTPSKPTSSPATTMNLPRMDAT